jgi:hypothetical protein
MSVARRPLGLTSEAGGKYGRMVARLGLMAIVVLLALTAVEQGFGAEPLPLTARVIAHREFAGFGPFGPSTRAYVHDSGVVPCRVSTSGDAVSSIGVGGLATAGGVRAVAV